MTIVDWLVPAKKPRRRWFLLIQDYIIFAMIFVSGTLGLFVNLWSDTELNCVPVLDCGKKSHATDCINKTNYKVVQDISLVVTNYIASTCSKHIKPQYLPYADLILFGACVALWVLHNLWLKMPPYSEIVVSYGDMDEEQRDEVGRKLKDDQARGGSETSGQARRCSETSCQARGGSETSGQARGGSETSGQAPEGSETSCQARGGSETSCQARGGSETSGQARRCSETSCQARRCSETSCQARGGSETSGQALRGSENESLIPRPEEAFIKAMKGLDKACWWRLNRLVQVSDGLCCALFLTMGILLVIMHIHLTSPFSCQLDPSYSIGVTYTSIECELRKIGGIYALYVICATGAFIISVLKFLLLCYYGCRACKCFTGSKQDAKILRRLLAENLTKTNQEGKKIGAHEIVGLNDWHETAFLAQVRGKKISSKDIPDLQVFTDAHYQRRTDINVPENLNPPDEDDQAMH